MSGTSLSRSFFSGRVITGLLVVAVVLLAAIPLASAGGSQFQGSDTAAENIIAEISPNTKPWFEPIWSPPGPEIESLLFALEAATGSAVIGYYFGLKRGKR